MRQEDFRKPQREPVAFKQLIGDFSEPFRSVDGAKTGNSGAMDFEGFYTWVGNGTQLKPDNNSASGYGILGHRTIDIHVRHASSEGQTQRQLTFVIGEGQYTYVFGEKLKVYERVSPETYTLIQTYM